ncbi:MAG TPA: oxidoreductase [Sphingobium sp.]|uniref:oxidoreductase n=1 Tax=Sphingobium sp. TaxID=1912891 RepID=UPI002ED0622B
MMGEIGVGLIGYGLGGRAFHAPYVMATPGMTLRAVLSRDAPKVHATLPAMTVVPDVDALLRLEGIDLVIVSSPDDLHAEHALAALRAGKHVVIDKPFATNLADAQKIAEEADQQNRLVAAFHNRRWDADFRTLQALVDAGTLGEIVTFESHFDRWRPHVAPVWKEARAGGSWFDLGPHLVDQALLLFGRPLDIYADIGALRHGAQAPDYFHVILRYERMRAILHSSKMTAQHGLRFAVHGTSGSWIKQGVDPQEAATVAGASPAGEDWGLDPSDGLLTRPETGASPVAVQNSRGDYRLFWQSLLTAIHGEGPNPVPPESAIAVIEILEAGLHSAREGRAVAL